jgi:hypothetical protein
MVELDPHGCRRAALAAVLVMALAGCGTHGLIGVLPVVPDGAPAAEIVVIREWRFIGGGADDHLEILAVNAPLFLSGSRIRCATS